MKAITVGLVSLTRRESLSECRPQPKPKKGETKPLTHRHPPNHPPQETPFSEVTWSWSMYPMTCEWLLSLVCRDWVVFQEGKDRVHITVWILSGANSSFESLCPWPLVRLGLKLSGVHVHWKESRPLGSCHWEKIPRTQPFLFWPPGGGYTFCKYMLYKCMNISKNKTVIL